MTTEKIETLPFVSIGKVAPMIERCLTAGIVPILKGSPGIGKSAIMAEIANKHNLQLVDQRLTQLDPTDLNGFPIPNKETGRSEFLPPAIFPIESDPLPEGKDGWLLFLDEITNASNMMQAAAYKLILDRKVGEIPLHSKCLVACAGNLITDRAAANFLNTAMQSRLVHFNIKTDKKEWVAWAQQNNIDHRVISYVGWKPLMLNNFNPDHKDNTFACERTWEFVSKYLNGANEVKDEDFPAIAGMIGVDVATEFTTFCDIYKDLPSIQDIMTNPDTIPMPERTDVQFALTGAVGERITVDNVKDLMPFIIRMDIEFQILTFKHAIGRNPAIQHQPDVVDWSMKHVSRLKAVS